MSTPRRPTPARHAAAALVLALTVVALGAQDGRAAGDADDLLARAATAASAVEFDGVVDVAWREGATVHHETVSVRSRAGHVQFGSVDAASGRVMSDTAERLVRDTGADWRLVWAAGDSLASPPSPSEKYELVTGDGPVVAGRTTTLVTASASGRTVERLAVDTETGVVLRREQLDRRGAVTRAVSFTSITVYGGVTRVTGPPPARSATPSALASVPAPYRAPEHAGDGFELVGRFRHDDGTVQLFYSDGLVGLSVFEMPGTLDWDALPGGGRRVEVDGHRARAWSTAVGEVLVWDADGVVYTCVSDVPDGDLDGVLAALGARDRRSFLASVADALLGPFRWR